MKIAITGGIGTGKSYICNLLRQRGISIFDCDSEAKRLMLCDTELQNKLKSLIGDDVYQGGILQKRVIASYLLVGENNKLAVNGIVHPAVARCFERSGIDWLESAILFESGFCQLTHFDYVICVTASKDVRLKRIMKRDIISEEKALQWINAQMPQEEILRLSDFEIINNGTENLCSQIDYILDKINITIN